MKGSSNTNKFRNFQIRWKEKLGYLDNPYLIRWTFILFGYSIRIHHWIKSDDNRFFHDHSSNLLSIVLKGHYHNVKPYDKDRNPKDIVTVRKEAFWNGYYSDNDEYVDVDIENSEFNYVEGIFNSLENFFKMNKSIWFSRAEDRHYLSIPKGGAWTLMFEGKPKHKWGFYVNGHKWRPLRYFHKYGIAQKDNYQ